jgi:hypothetical protein
MKKKQEFEKLITERWPKLKQKAQNEENPEKIIAILEEIDDLLFKVEMRIAAQNGRTQSRNYTDSRAGERGPHVVPADDSEIGSQ